MAPPPSGTNRGRASPATESIRGKCRLRSGGRAGPAFLVEAEVLASAGHLSILRLSFRRPSADSAPLAYGATRRPLRRGLHAPRLRIRPARRCGRSRDRPGPRRGSRVRSLVRFLVRFACRLLAARVNEVEAEGRNIAGLTAPGGTRRLAPRPLQAGGRWFEPGTAH